jgi:hypothetical protein
MEIFLEGKGKPARREYREKMRLDAMGCGTA